MSSQVLLLLSEIFQLVAFYSPKFENFMAVSLSLPLLLARHSCYTQDCILEHLVVIPCSNLDSVVIFGLFTDLVVLILNLRLDLL